VFADMGNIKNTIKREIDKTRYKLNIVIYLR